MDSQENAYKGLKCSKCELWFCRKYLFFKHNRRFHNRLSDFVVLPALSVETMQFLNESKHTPFAILHLPCNKKLLMSVSDNDTHCTMRVATKADLPTKLQASEQELHGDAKVVVVCDVYPHRDTAGVDSYEVVPRIRPKITENHMGNFNQGQNEKPKTSGNLQKQRKTLPYPSKDQNGSFGTVAHLLQNTSNPFCDELERIANLL